MRRRAPSADAFDHALDPFRDDAQLKRVKRPNVLRASGISVTRVIDRAHARVSEHAHDWPVLSLHVLGRYQNRTEIGEVAICGPSAIFYRAGASHANAIGAVGFEQIEIEFDPAWLKQIELPERPVSRWLGGATSAAARKLARACASELSIDQIRKGLVSFFETARHAPDAPRPPWVDDVVARLREDPSLRVQQLSRELDLHPSWLGSAFRRATGEGVLEHGARLRVEAAATALRETTLRCTEIAASSGFCDQSHMNRSFERVLGRSPSAVRRDQGAFRTMG